MTAKKPNATRGRPRTVNGDYAPNRAIGRVPDATWEIIQAAIEASGESQTAWIVLACLERAERESRKRKS